MKKYYLFSLLYVINFVAFSQEEKASPKPVFIEKQNLKSVQNSTTHTVSSPSSNVESTPQDANYPVTYSVNASGEQVELNKAYYENQLKSVEYLINAIDQKVEYVNSDQNMREEAIENGWFEQMKSNKNEVEKKRDSIIEKIKSFN
ncbi:MAG: hypothetical protein M9916_07690 [Crocinitomicaceae bacterium]|nr:hypothetical protein [Crocinitomicaceae bacterium]